ncbi:outer membrane beta-barrel protein [Olleya sp. ITB9]|uniref:outer membrane beta-barrel protein n=1 Tax=Olleya sp. ITB9 TaxID=1715648 RepID=UPI0006D10784|nr:outer membrane beta-barrel protein [Olleya sp. ITB9]
MKKQFALFGLLLIAVVGYSQEVEEPSFYLLKGNVIVEGMIGYSNDTDARSGADLSEYIINPKAGYLFGDDFAVGLDLSYQHSEESDDDTEKNIEETITAGLFLRYYFLDLGKRFKVYGELGGDYVKLEGGFESNTQKATGFQVGLNLGVNYFVKDNIAISFVLSDVANYRSLNNEAYYIGDDLVSEEGNTNSLNVDLNVFKNFFQTAQFGVMFKF